MAWKTSYCSFPSCRQRFFAGRGNPYGELIRISLVSLVVFDVGADGSHAHVLDNDKMYDVCHVKCITPFA